MPRSARMCPSRRRPSRVRPASPPHKVKLSITQHNLRVKLAVKQRAIPLARKVLLYPTDSTRPRIIWLPSRESYDPACGSNPWPDDLDNDEWFRGPQTMTSLHYFPGTDCHLKNGYDVFVLACLERSRRVDELNLTVQSLFSLRWTGNIIVVKRGFRDRGCALSITPPEVSLINSLVERWLQTEL